MKSFFWLLFKAAIFFLLFAFAMGNRDEVALHFMPGHVVTMPMMAVVVANSSECTTASMVGVSRFSAAS